MKLKSKKIMFISILFSIALMIGMIAAMSQTVYAGDKGYDEGSEGFITVNGNGLTPEHPKPGPASFFADYNIYGSLFYIWGDYTSYEGIDISSSPDSHNATISRCNANELTTITKVECIGYGDFSKLTSTEGEISVDEYEEDKEKSIATITGEHGAHLDVGSLKIGAAEDSTGPIKITDMKVYYIEYKSYEVYVAGTQVTGRNLNDVLADDPVNAGKVSYEPLEDEKSGVLTLSGVEIPTIYSKFINLTIILNGENIVGDVADPNSINNAINIYGYVPTNLVITGEGSLTAKGYINGINVVSALTISGVTVDAHGHDEGIGSESLTIEKNSKVTASGWHRAIRGKVKNDVAGTGWAGYDVSWGRKEIEISEEPQDLTDYKILMFPKAPYDIAVFPAVNGKVETDKEKAYPGDTVTVTAAPDKGYKLKSINVAAPMKEIDSVRDLATLMGDAEFTGTRKPRPGAPETEEPGYSLKFQDDAFCIFDNNGELQDQFDINGATFTPKPGGEYEATKDHGKINWIYTVKYGELVEVTHSNLDTGITYNFTGEGSGSLPKETIATKAVKEGEKYTFTMPAANVEVSAEFEPVPPAPKVSGTQMAKMSAKGKKSLTISWNKIKGAAGYDIFFAKCTKHDTASGCKKVKTIKGNKTFKWKKSGLKKGKAYKAYVRAYVMQNGKKKYVTKSPLMHAYTGNGTKKYTNAKSVKLKNVKKGKLSLKKGKAFKIKAKVIKINKKKKLMPKGHAPALRYMTTNKKVATVSKSGKITAKGKGKCTIYAYAHNGVSKSIKVIVP